MFSLGLDIGYSSVKLALMDNKNRIIHHAYALHRGNIRYTLRSLLYEMRTGFEVEKIRWGSITGSGGRVCCKEKITFANEAAAVVEGAIAENPSCRSIIEIGGQSAKFVTEFTPADKSRIKISINANCSAGTGSFLEEQVSRLKLKLEDFAAYAKKAKHIPRIAGRCSVFAKTDITHHQQEGVPIEDILQGLAHALVRNYRGSLMRTRRPKMPVMFVGGVAHNQAISHAFKNILNVTEGEFIVPEHFAVVGAMGAAVIAKRQKNLLNTDELLKELEQGDDLIPEVTTTANLAKLLPFGDDDALGKHELGPVNPRTGGMECWLGIDVGSTSTNLVLTDKDHRMVSFQYLKTLGKPLEAVQKGLAAIENEFGKNIRIAGVGTTGSGRLMIGKVVGADVIKDEITSQAKAAAYLDPAVDTVFEMGGQDSKYIRLKDGIVTDFQMNKICAAGTGSFIEEQAAKFSIPVQDFGATALRSTRPVPLGERCAVFMETSVAAHLAGGRLWRILPRVFATPLSKIISIGWWGKKQSEKESSYRGESPIIRELLTHSGP